MPSIEAKILNGQLASWQSSLRVESRPEMDPALEIAVNQFVFIGSVKEYLDRPGFEDGICEGLKKNYFDKGSDPELDPQVAEHLKTIWTMAEILPHGKELLIMNTADQLLHEWSKNASVKLKQKSARATELLYPFLVVEDPAWEDILSGRSVIAKDFKNETNYLNYMMADRILDLQDNSDWENVLGFIREKSLGTLLPFFDKDKQNENKTALALQILKMEDGWLKKFAGKSQASGLSANEGLIRDMAILDMFAYGERNPELALNSLFSAVESFPDKTRELYAVAKKDFHAWLNNVTDWTFIRSNHIAPLHLFRDTELSRLFYGSVIKNLPLNGSYGFGSKDPDAIPDYEYPLSFLSRLAVIEPEAKVFEIEGAKRLAEIEAKSIRLHKDYPDQKDRYAHYDERYKRRLATILSGYPDKIISSLVSRHPELILATYDLLLEGRSRWLKKKVNKGPPRWTEILTMPGITKEDQQEILNKAMALYEDNTAAFYREIKENTAVSAELVRSLPESEERNGFLRLLEESEIRKLMSDTEKMIEDGKKNNWNISINSRLRNAFSQSDKILSEGLRSEYEKWVISTGKQLLSDPGVPGGLKRDIDGKGIFAVMDIIGIQQEEIEEILANTRVELPTVEDYYFRHLFIERDINKLIAATGNGYFKSPSYLPRVIHASMALVLPREYEEFDPAIKQLLRRWLSPPSGALTDWKTVLGEYADLVFDYWERDNHFSSWIHNDRDLESIGLTSSYLKKIMELVRQ